MGNFKSRREKKNISIFINNKIVPDSENVRNVLDYHKLKYKYLVTADHIYIEPRQNLAYIPNKWFLIVNIKEGYSFVKYDNNTYTLNNENKILLKININFKKNNIILKINDK